MWPGLEDCESNRERAWDLLAVGVLPNKGGVAEIDADRCMAMGRDSTNRAIPAILRATQYQWGIGNMIKLLIHRNPMAEYIMEDLVKKAGVGNELRIASAATRSRRWLTRGIPAISTLPGGMCWRGAKGCWTI